MESLYQLYQTHVGKVSDKWESYLRCYEALWADRRDKPVSLLEIGVQNGGSLEIWSRYFPNAVSLIGCDINPHCAGLRYADPRINIVIGDANNDATWGRISAIQPSFDIIIDDGSHRSSDVIKAFGRYFPRLKDGGVFVVEDLYHSYWRQFEGGLFDPFSSISFFKRLIDVVNFEHWGVAAERTSILEAFAAKYGAEFDGETLARIHSVEFMNSMSVIRKSPPAENSLGPRFIAGIEEAVAKGHLPLFGSAAWVPPQDAGAASSDPLAIDKGPLSNKR